MMKIDLHLHTSDRSPCSDISISELIAEAKRIGLDGFCMTEHQFIWPLEETEELARNEGIRIFRGNEITSAQGDVLVYGLEKDIKGVVPIKALQKEVVAAGAFSVLAHPFRGFKMFGIGELQMSVEQACKKKALQFVNAVEIANGKVRDKENEMAMKVAEALGLPGTAGSDAHNVDEVGLFVTIFERDIKNDADLVAELHAGRFSTGNAR
ncbi:MAG: PHP domain-containing protein [Deltaproteobacteria bacterium]|nr:PHP domain-containing protein [Deltaproteobacteria bacterium]